MPFHEVRFPTDISWGSRGGPGFNTSVVVLGSGHEQRNVNWEDARCEYDVSYGVKGSTQLSDLISFFRARYGRAYGFRYKDWFDYVSSSETCTTISSSDGTYQIAKVYESGSTYTFTRELTKIVSGSLHVYVDGSTTGASWTADYNTGIITMSSATTKAITASCEFDVPVRFDVDKLTPMIDNVNKVSGYFGEASIPVIEIRTT